MQLGRFANSRKCVIYIANIQTFFIYSLIMSSLSSLDSNSPKDQQAHFQQASLLIIDAPTHGKSQQEKYETERFSELKQMIVAGRTPEKLSGMVTLHKLLEKEGTVLYQRIIDEDLFSEMVDWIYEPYYEQLQLEAVRVVYGVFRSGTLQQCRYLTQIMIIDILSQLLRETSSGEIVRLIAESLELLLNRSLEFGRKFKTTKPFKALIVVLGKQKLRDSHQICLQSLLALCHSFPINERHAAAKICFLQIAKILTAQRQYNTKIITKCFQIYQAHAYQSHFLRKIIRGDRVRPVLVRHLQEKREDTLQSCLSIVGAIIHHMPRHAINLKLFQPLDLLNYLSQILCHGDPSIRLTGCGILNSISQSTLYHCSLHSLKNRPLIYQMLLLLEVDSEHIKAEICEIFDNLFHMTLPHQRMLALRKKVIQLSIDCLNSEKQVLIKRSLLLLNRIFQTHDSSLASFIEYKGPVFLQKLNRRNNPYFFNQISIIRNRCQRYEEGELVNSSESLKFPHHGSSESSSSWQLKFSRSEDSNQDVEPMEDSEESSSSEGSY